MDAKRVSIFLVTAVLFLCVFFGAPCSFATEEPELSKGQTIYVPAYPSVYIDERGRNFLLTTSLVIRNTDPKYSITIASIDFYDDKGALIKKYLDAPVKMPPLGAIRYLAKRIDKKGESDGKCFIVKWSGDGNAVNTPILQTIMIGVESMQGISFMQSGQVISEH